MRYDPTTPAAHAGAAETRRGRGPTRPGVVLLEVVLAMVLFFGASLVILSVMNRSLRTAQRVQLDAQATDLAVTLFSEIQMGLVAPDDDGPNPYDDDETLSDWTWEIVTTPVEEESLELELPQFQQVEIIIRNAAEGHTHRLVQWMPEQVTEVEAGGAADAQPTGPTGGGIGQP